MLDPRGHADSFESGSSVVGVSPCRFARRTNSIQSGQEVIIKVTFPVRPRHTRDRLGVFDWHSPVPHLCIFASLLLFIPSCHEPANLFALKFGHPQGGLQVGDEVEGGQALMDLTERATHFLHCALQRQ